MKLFIVLIIGLVIGSSFLKMHRCECDLVQKSYLRGRLVNYAIWGDRIKITNNNRIEVYSSATNSYYMADSTIYLVVPRKRKQNSNP